MAGMRIEVWLGWGGSGPERETRPMTGSCRRWLKAGVVAALGVERG